MTKQRKRTRLSLGQAAGKRYLLAALMVLVLISGRVWAAETAADFFVAPGGNDRWSGGLAGPNAEGTDGPLATIHRAQQAVRELKQREPKRNRPIVVVVRGGTYYLDRPISFGPQDSGTQQAPIVYRAYADERPIFSGGERITGWQVGDDGRWRATLKEVKDGRWSFAQLFVDDQRRFRPRLPKQGYYKIAREVPPSPKAAGKGFDRFGFSGQDLKADWANPGDVEVVAFHQWSASRMRVASVDPKEHIVTFTGTTRGTSGWAKFANGHRFLAVNVREALDRPGEWYLDRPTGELTYIPKPGERPRQTDVVAPRLEQLVVFAGDGEKQSWVAHVGLHGLTFAHSNWILPPEG